MKKILDYPAYLITSSGQVTSKRFKRFLKAQMDDYGYLHVLLYKNGKSIICKVNRLVLETFVGPCPKGMVCRHLNGIRTDNRLENLRWGTPKENSADMKQHGTAPIGEKHGCAKLTVNDVKNIRHLYETGRYEQKELAKLYDVVKSTVWRIVHNKGWKHLVEA
jgi:hypothetical protein